ncbi:MAG TPA: hypothetical protein P5120_06170 [Spirochaetota bacterium]|nr:hypothetical protein [Spirochaetota bacterium]
MIRFNSKILVFILLIHVSALISCSNIINEEVLSDADNTSVIDDGNDSGIPFTELSRTYSTSGDIRIEKSAGEGYYIAGTVVEDIADNVWFSVIDNKGNFKNEAFLKSGYDDRVRRVKVLDNENLIIYADRYYEDGDIDFIIAKVNKNTGIIWDYCFGDETKNRVFDITATDDGGTLITGLSYYQVLGFMRYITFTMKIDSNGRSVWKKDYRSLFSVFMPSEIRDAGNGEYLVSGLCLNRITNKFKTFFTRISSTGDVLSSIFINAAGMHTMLIGASAGEDGGFTGVISLTGGSYSDSIVVAGFDNGLNIQSLREYSLPDLNVRGKYVKGADGSIIIAGMLNNEAGNGLYFLRLSERGVIQNLTTKYYDEDKYNITDVYFNTEETADGLLYLCRYKNSTISSTDGRLFLDRTFTVNKYIPALSRGYSPVNSDLADYETGGVDLETGDSSLMERGDASLSFVIN